jgi:hypothetical protein
MNSFKDESMLVNFSSVGQIFVDFSTVSRNLCLALCVSVIASCGGGGGGSSNESEPGVNNSPSLVNPGIIELPEERDVVITLNGSDEDGDGLKYSILGGTDHAVLILLLRARSLLNLSQTLKRLQMWVVTMCMRCRFRFQMAAR